MPHNEDAYSHPDRSALPGGRAAVHQRSGSLTNLARLPGVARAKLHHSLSHNPFVRFLEDNDGQDKDENDIYRQKASCKLPGWRLLGHACCEQQSACVAEGAGRLQAFLSMRPALWAVIWGPG